MTWQRRRGGGDGDVGVRQPPDMLCLQYLLHNILDDKYSTHARFDHITNGGKQQQRKSADRLKMG